MWDHIHQIQRCHPKLTANVFNYFKTVLLNLSSVLQSMTMFHLSSAIFIDSHSQTTSNSNFWHWFTSASQTVLQHTSLNLLAYNIRPDLYAPPLIIDFCAPLAPKQHLVTKGSMVLNFGTISPTASVIPSHYQLSNACSKPIFLIVDFILFIILIIDFAVCIFFSYFFMQSAVILFVVIVRALYKCLIFMYVCKYICSESLS